MIVRDGLNNRRMTRGEAMALGLPVIWTESIGPFQGKLTGEQPGPVTAESVPEPGAVGQPTTRQPLEPDAPKAAVDTGKGNDILGESETRREITGPTIETLEDLLYDPAQLGYATPQEWYDFLQQKGYDVQPLSGGRLKGVAFQDGGGFKVNWGGDRILQYHPEGGHHGKRAYWKISSGTTGRIRFDLLGNILIE